MLAKIKDFVKNFIDRKFYDIMLVIIVALLIMLSFAAGFITAKSFNKEPVQIENTK